MDWTFLLLTGVMAVLIGYILGKGSIKIVPPPPISAVSPVPAKKTKSRSSKQAKSTLTTTPATPATSSTTSEELKDDSGATSTALAAATAADASAETSPIPTPTNRSRRSSSVSSLDGEKPPRSKRIVIVAKQLPLLTRAGPDGKFVRDDATTGVQSLVHKEWEDNRSFLSGLRALREDGFDITWVGVPNTGGVPVRREEQEVYEELLAQEDCVPVYLSPDLAEKYFNGFCKGVLWPMLHYVLPQSNQQFSAQWDELWQAYNAANAAFATVIARCVETPTDTIWVHNYHLLLLPSLLRRKLPRAKIGIFIHTPFPSSDVFRVLPTRHNILSSIMASDLLGFHTFDYARHFLSCIKRVMDLDFETLPGGALGIKYAGRFVSILISHVGIDSEMFLNMREDRGVTQGTGGAWVGSSSGVPAITSSSSSDNTNTTTTPDALSSSLSPPTTASALPPPEQTVAAEVEYLHKKHAGRRIVISAGDLDSVKGGLLKFQAYDRFFERYHEQWKDKVVFIEMLLPNRSVKLDHVQDLKILMDEACENIHKKWGQDVLEVMHLKEALNLKSTVAHFAAADVCIASQFWDGLNLLPFEYTACQRDQQNPGALIISEFMGCSRTLSGVLRVNPWNLDDVAEALNSALSLTQSERIINHQRRYKYVMDHTILRWGRVFLQHLDRATKLCEGMNYVQVGWGSNVKLLGLRSDFSHLDEESVTQAYRKAERRVLLLDYDGTLTPAEKTAVKSRLMGPSKQVKKLLHSLTSDPDNIVFIMSGRTRSTLTEWFPSSEFPELGLAAEKGLFLSWPKRLTFLCRQDLRRDSNLKKRVEARQIELQQQRERELQTNKEKTSESRVKEFVSYKKLQVNSEEKSNELALPTTTTGTLSHSASSNDAHLLIEQEAFPVDDTEWEYMIALDDVSWKTMALEIIRSYTEQTDGSWIEDKEFAIVWHYEQADPEYGRMQASELQKYLVKILANPNVDVVRYDYNRILEVKPHGVSKGLAATAILEELFMMHTEKMKNSRPPSPILSGIDEGREFTGGSGSGSGFRSNRGSHNNLASLASSPTSPSSGHARASSSNSVFQQSSPSHSALPPFLFCVGDDRSDEDMFLSVQNKDYLEGKLRTASHAHLIHQHSLHGLQSSSSSSSSPSPDGLLKRSMSAVSSGHKVPLMSNQARQAAAEMDEKTLRERRKDRIADPFTFTVCVGMKPSNAHYYLHDDEEVVKLLTALGTSSQRMAQTRAADNKALNANPVGSPIAGGTTGSMGRSFPSGQITNVNTARGGAGVWSLRPADIPTSPPIQTSSIQANYALQQQSTLGMQRGASLPNRARGGPQPPSTTKPSSDSEEDEEEDEPEEVDSDDAEFLKEKSASKAQTGGGGGMRRAL